MAGPVATSGLLRALHVLAMGVLAGGALLLALAPAPLRLARAYEWAFWIALSLSLLSGVANLGVLAPSIPSAQTAWGRLLVAKLALLLIGALLSLARALLVLRLPASDESGGAVRLAYGATSLAVAAAAVLGVAMSHA